MIPFDLYLYSAPHIQGLHSLKTQAQKQEYIELTRPESMLMIYWALFEDAVYAHIDRTRLKECLEDATTYGEGASSTAAPWFDHARPVSPPVCDSGMPRFVELVAVSSVQAAPPWDDQTTLALAAPQGPDPPSEAVPPPCRPPGHRGRDLQDHNLGQVSCRQGARHGALPRSVSVSGPVASFPTGELPLQRTLPLGRAQPPHRTRPRVGPPRLGRPAPTPLGQLGTVSRAS